MTRMQPVNQQNPFWCGHPDPCPTQSRYEPEWLGIVTCQECRHNRMCVCCYWKGSIPQCLGPEECVI